MQNERQESATAEKASAESAASTQVVTAEETVASAEEAEHEQTTKERVPYFTTLRIAYMAVFTAFSYLMYMPFLEFAIVPAVEFLKIDFSNVFVMIAGFSLGPVSAVIVGVLKEVLHALTFSTTVGVGELANCLVMLPYILVPAVVYKRHKGIKTVLLTLAVGCLGQTLASFPVNCWISFPAFLGFNWQTGVPFFLSVWYWVMLFNLIKTLLISAVVLLLYKPLSRLIKLINGKFAARRHA